ncbi:MAG: HAMP domain-containing histidine kinase [Lachnospiraceae bacterium]|nr:HAMP domain-containing histidine kinase [Lachnospiraceae bacterium]
MHLSLRKTLIIGYLAVVVIGFSLLATFGVSFSKAQCLSSTLNRLYKDANYIAASFRVNDGRVSQQFLEEAAFLSESDIWMLDTEGRVTASSGRPSGVAVVAGFDPASGEKGYYMIGRFYGTFTDERVSVYTPLTLSILPSGYVVLHYPMLSVNVAADQALLLAYITFGASMLILLGLVLLIDRLWIVPLKKVRDAGVEYTNGNLSYPNDVRTGNEIGQIADQQADLARQLNENSEEQHRFLANISHDFRSPLTSIRGYLTAIQDGTIPPELQGKYIDVVLGETNRLKDLANDVLDMTLLESGVTLSKSIFDLHHLIRMIISTYEGRMEEKDLVFNLTFETESQNVYADEKRIEQVLHNLIDNAVKFSNSSSSVDISTHLRNDRVFVSVSDHGIGIQKEELNKIWNRFYKSDASRGKDKKGTGLGLAIVREIIQAHGESIDVISTPGVGTEFIFTLQATR